MPVDPRLGGVLLGMDPRDAQIASLWQTVRDQQRQINDLRSSALIQTGASTPTAAGLTGRDGTPYGQTANTFWLRLGGQWRGVAMPLT